jgi:hypothetical protein
MAGLYAGVEEIPFKPIDGGYVFQTNNRWLVGPKRRYFVTAAQKVEIAACIRETLRRMKPFIFAVALLMPLALIGGTFWLAFRGATLNVTTTDAAGHVSTYAQSIDRAGSMGTIAGPAGTSVVFKVSGPPSKDATISYTHVDAAGKAGAPTVVFLGTNQARLNMAESNGHIYSSTVFASRIGATPNAILLDAMLLALCLFVPYFAAVHIYSMRRLAPLIADLPRTDARITLPEGTQNLAAKASYKLIAVIGIGGVLGLLGNAMNLLTAYLEDRPATNPQMTYVNLVLCGFVTAYFITLLILKAKAKKIA